MEKFEQLPEIPTASLIKSHGNIFSTARRVAFVLGACILCNLTIASDAIYASADHSASAATSPSKVENKITKPEFNLDEANKLVELPLACVEQEYPNKLQQTLAGEEDLKSPKTLHPIFYGCFDWHSAVHGYWSLVTLLKEFPKLAKAEEVRAILSKNITAGNVTNELKYFEEKINKSFERTYGWAWLLKLVDTLHSWDDPLGQNLAKQLQPLADNIADKYIDFLPKLVYPIRVGEHTNTAFGLSFAYDYAVATRNLELKALISERAKSFFASDKGCPISWEPSGFDFLSPCFEEINIMRRVLNKTEFSSWLEAFMPDLSQVNYQLTTAKVVDRSDGKLVHLDGLNFSRAWVFYGLARQHSQYQHLIELADEHMAASYPNLVGDSYEGGHWLGSFAINALVERFEDNPR